MSRERCKNCGRPVESLLTDVPGERILVSGRAIHVAIQVPGLEGDYVQTFGRRIHQCPRRRA